MNSIPLDLPEVLTREVKRAASEAGLSVSDAMIEAIKIGLPHLRQALSKEADLSEAVSDTWDKLGDPPTVLYDQL